MIGRVTDTVLTVVRVVVVGAIVDVVVGAVADVLVGAVADVLMIVVVALHMGGTISHCSRRLTSRTYLL